MVWFICVSHPEVITDKTNLVWIESLSYPLYILNKHPISYLSSSSCFPLFLNFEFSFFHIHVIFLFFHLTLSAEAVFRNIPGKENSCLKEKNCVKSNEL